VVWASRADRDAIDQTGWAFPPGMHGGYPARAGERMPVC